MASYSVTQYSLLDTEHSAIIYLPNYTVSHSPDTEYPYPVGPRADGYLYTRFLWRGSVFQILDSPFPLPQAVSLLTCLSNTSVAFRKASTTAHFHRTSKWSPTGNLKSVFRAISNQISPEYEIMSGGSFFFGRGVWELPDGVHYFSSSPSVFLKEFPYWNCRFAAQRNKEEWSIRNVPCHPRLYRV
jgi:hypothetical protein